MSSRATHSAVRVPSKETGTVIALLLTRKEGSGSFSKWPEVTVLHCDHTISTDILGCSPS